MRCLKWRTQELGETCLVVLTRTQREKFVKCCGISPIQYYHSKRYISRGYKSVVATRARYIDGYDLS